MPTYRRQRTGRDRVQEKLRRRHERYLQKKKAEAEEAKLKSASEPRSYISDEERHARRKKSEAINLKTFPVAHEKFCAERLELLINFFIEQFLAMVTVCNEHRAYAQATMYIMQADNLCKILLENGLGNVALEESVFRKHQVFTFSLIESHNTPKNVP